MARLRRPRRVQRRNWRHDFCRGRNLFRPLLRGRGRRKRDVPTNERKSRINFFK